MNIFFGVKRNKQNSGFSLVELVVAIGILAVISTIVAFMMTSSSKNYGRMSVETQLQSEAQLVANAISEYAIDSYNAENLSTETIDATYVNEENKILVLHSLARDGVEYDYVIARTAENKLYLGERSKPVGSTWSAFSFSLLGNYISDFTVDTSHVESENIINFQLTYTKNKRSYNGNYQVLMRNRAYADKEDETNNNPEPLKLVLGLQPKQVYVDIINGAAGNYYYENEISDGGRRNLGPEKEIKLNATVTSNKLLNDNTVEWFINGEDSNCFSLPEADNNVLSQSAKLKVLDGNFDNSAIDDFTVSIAKSVADADGNTVSATSKQTKIHLRRVKSIRLIATSGSTAWKSVYDTYLNDDIVKSDDVDGYAYPDAYGKYYTMVLNANIVQRWVPYAGGLTWKIEMREPGSSTWITPSASNAKLQYNETNSSTTNSVLFGSAVMNGQVYKVTATSKFDGSKYAEYTFGIAPREREEGGGEYSRGFYINLNEVFKKENYPAQSNENDNIGLEGLNVHSQPYDHEVLKKKKITRIEMTSSGQTGQGTVYDLTTPNEASEQYFYIDYASAMYSQRQRLDFYAKPVMFQFDVYSGDEHLATIYYDMRPVYVCKKEPASDVLVIPRGKSTDVLVNTKYYNIIGSDYFGVYIDNDSTLADGENDSKFSNNLNNANFDTNAYLRVEYASSYGDAKHFVDTARVTLTAKESQVYNANPMTVRFTADDYYKLCFIPDYELPIERIKPNNPIKYNDKESITYNPSDLISNDIDVCGRYGWMGKTRSATDYTVYIANVVGQNVFISGPATTVGVCAFPSTVKNATVDNPVAIGGYDSNGLYYSDMARAYMQGTKYMCVYNGNTYTYNQTYHYWSN